MRRPLRYFVALLVICLLAVSCGGDSDQAADSGGANTAGSGPSLEDFKMAVMLPGTVDDKAWNLSMDQAARAVADELDIEVSISNNTFDPTESEPVLRQFLSGGYNLIVVHGFNFEPVLNEVAPKNPDQLFTMASFGDPKFDNTSMYTWSYLESGYSMCWLGAQLSESGTIGMVGAADVPYNVELHEGCRLGARDADEGVEVLEAYANDFFDQQKAYEQGQSLVDQGADAIFASGGVDSTIGALNFCEENNIICMGVNTDQSEVAPNSVVSSAITDWQPFLKDWIDQAATGEFKPAVYNATFGNGGLTFPPFDGPSAEKVPEDVQTEFMDMIDRLASEEIELPESEAHPGYR